MLGRSFKYQLLASVALALPSGWPAAAAPTPIVDTRTSSPVTNVSREQLERLPAGRRIEDLIRTCPGQTIPTVSSQPQALTGGGQAGTQYLIDGKPMVDINCIQPADIDMIEVYRTHNSARAEYGAAPLVWSPNLVAGAQTYANQLATTGKTGPSVHSSREGRGTVRENISQGQPWWSTQQLLGAWTKEKKNFKPGIFPNVSTTGNWYDIGHWAQMIWIQTVIIGCAKAAGVGGLWLVCRYDPGGNKDGKPVGIPPLRIAQVEQPKLPNVEVFGPNAAKVPQSVATKDIAGDARHRDHVVSGLSLAGALSANATGRLGYQGCFGNDYTDHGIYSSLTLHFGGAPDCEEQRVVDSIIALDHDYGYDGGLFVGYDLGSFRIEAEVAYKQADIESYNTTIKLPGETPTQAVSSDGDMMGRRASLFDLGIYGGGAYTTDWFAVEEPPLAPGYDVFDAFAEIRLPLIRDVPFFGNDQRYADSWYSGLNSGSTVNWEPIEDLLFRGSWAEGFGGQASAGPHAADSPWLQDTLTIGNLTVNMGLRYDAFDGDYVPSNTFVPLTQNGTLNLAYIWLMSDTATAIGGGNRQWMSGFKWPDLVANVRVDQAWGAAQLSAALHQLEALNTFVPLQEQGSGDMGQRMSQFDLGIYGGGAYTTDWFTLDVPGGINLLPGFGGGFGFLHYQPIVGSLDLPFTLTFDTGVDTKVEQPTLPKMEVFNPAQLSAYEKHIRGHWEAVMKMAEGTPYERTVSNLMVGYSSYVNGKWTCNQAMELAGKGQVDAALAALKQMKSQMTETGEYAAADAEEIDTLIGDYESLMHHQNPQGSHSAEVKPAAPAPESDTKIGQPDLPTSEVFNPASAPNCPSDVM